MATVKVTALFEATSNAQNPTAPRHRVGGWSESFYFNGTVAQAQTVFQQGRSWCSFRAALLPTGVSIVGQRYQQIDPVGPTGTLAQLFPGTAGIAADIPQAALLFKCAAQGAANSRAMILRGVPDARIVQGEYEPAKAYDDAILEFTGYLKNFQFRARDLSQPKVPIQSIDSTGLVTTVGAHGLAAGNYVRILRTVAHDHGEQVGGRFLVQSAPSLNTFTIPVQTFMPSVGGFARKDLTVYLTIQDGGVTLSRVITRRVGRPFGQYRGRRSKRRS